jgi:hypothetical protein
MRRELVNNRNGFRRSKLMQITEKRDAGKGYKLNRRRFSFSCGTRRVA